ncbi:hypothetical protein C8R44DRAFT_763370 [Mycena epipterygia]|nr:hypothetical protein C8R44DRAFT_763370 [Mycena epipterygia]
MLLCMFRPALRHVNRLGIPISSPTRPSVPTLTRIWKRQYAVSSPEYESESPEPAAKKKKAWKHSAPNASKPWAKKHAVKQLALPAAPPAPLTEPLVQSDFPEYLVPLYTRGWTLIPGKMPVERGETKHRAGYRLQRNFRFRNLKEMEKFSNKTREWLGFVSFCQTPRFSHPEFTLKFPSVTLNRGLVRLAIEAETEYEKIVGSNFCVPVPKDVHWVMTPPTKELDEFWENSPRVLENLAPIRRVSLPCAPPASVWPLPPIEEADIKTYLAPLVANGWSVESISRKVFNLRGRPALCRVYSFPDFTSARDFVHSVIAVVPDPRVCSYESVELRMDRENPSVKVGSISEDKRRVKRFAISYTNVRFAIQVENIYLENWAGRPGEDTAAETRNLPANMDQFWDTRSSEKALGTWYKRPEWERLPTATGKPVMRKKIKGNVILFG